MSQSSQMSIKLFQLSPTPAAHCTVQLQAPPTVVGNMQMCMTDLGSRVTRPPTALVWRELGAGGACMARLGAALLLLAAVDAGLGQMAAAGGQANTGPVQDLSAPSRTPK